MEHLIRFRRGGERDGECFTSGTRMSGRNNSSEGEPSGIIQPEAAPLPFVALIQIAPIARDVDEGEKNGLASREGYPRERRARRRFGRNKRPDCIFNASRTYEGP